MTRYSARWRRFRIRQIKYTQRLWEHLNAGCLRVSASALLYDLLSFPLFVFLTMPLPRRLFILLVGQWATAFLFVENRLIFFFFFTCSFSIRSRSTRVGFSSSAGSSGTMASFSISHWLIFLS